MLSYRAKVALLTHKVRATATPAYLSDLIQTRVPIRTLRSSDAPLLAVPRTRTELARRAFSVAAPSIWNSLPADIRLCESVPLFNIIIIMRSEHLAPGCIPETSVWLLCYSVYISQMSVSRDHND